MQAVTDMDACRYEHVPEPVKLLTVLELRTLPSFNKTELEMHRIEALWSLSGMLGI